MRSVLLLFVIAFSGVHSIIFYKNLPQIPGHEGQCYEGDIFYNRGDIISFDGKECVEVKCVGYWPEFNSVRIETSTCPKIQAGPGTMIVQNPHLPYPGCCPILVADPDFRKCCNPALAYN